MVTTPNEAKKITKQLLLERNIIFRHLTAKTIAFTDLARKRRIFVKVHGFVPNPSFEEVKIIARDYGFRVETDWMFN